MRGLRRDSLAGQIDVAPTVLELLGIQPETRLPGTSLLELVKDPRSREGAYLLTEVDLGANRKAVVGRGMKYVREFAPTEQEFLYDLREDPGELQDLLPAGRGAAEHHAEFLSAFASSTSAGFSILVQNGEETPMEVEVYLASREGPLPHVRIFNAEWGAEESRDGPLALYEVDVSGLSLHVARARLFVEPDDSDGVLLDHPDEAAVLVAVRVRGAWVPPERYLLGPSIPAREVPILLRSDLTTYDAPRFPPREDLGAEPYRIRVWRNLSARTDDGTMSAETLAALEAMGYLGGEE